MELERRADFSKSLRITKNVALTLGLVVLGILENFAGRIVGGTNFWVK